MTKKEICVKLKGQKQESHHTSQPSSSGTELHTKQNCIMKGVYVLTDQEFLELFRQSTTMLWEQTIQQLLEDNKTYQQVLNMEEQAEQQYLQMDLSTAQRTVIDNMLLQKERSALLYADVSYLAGVKNMLQLYHALRL